MNCAAATERMLEADRQDLAGGGDPELAAHLAECVRCREVADRFISAQLGLASELDASEPTASADEALRAARRRSSSVSRRNVAWKIGAPLAVAAGLASIVFGTTDDMGPTAALAQSREVLPGLEVEAPPGKDVAVFKVADRPDVVVVWFFEAGD